MIGALFFLQSRTVKNHILHRLRRLKRPKYFLGFLVGGLYYGLFMFRPWMQGGKKMSGAAWSLLPEDIMTMFEVGAAVVLMLVVLMNWVIPGDRAKLRFSEAEIAFLFPAPVSRTTLLHFRLLRTQVGIFFSALLMALFTGRLRSLDSGLLGIVSWWLMMSTLGLHFLAISFVQTMLLDSGITVARRRVGVVAVAVLLLGGLYLWIRETVPPPVAIMTSPQASVANYVTQVMASPPVFLILFPFRLLVHPFFVRDFSGFLVAAAPVLGIFLLNYIWVMRSDVAFEEASIDAARKTADRISALRSGRTDPMSGLKKRTKNQPFQLAGTGPEYIALLWKNLIAAGRILSGRFWLILLGLLCAAAAISRHPNVGQAMPVMLTTLSCMMVGFIFTLGSALVRYDFRFDLPAWDILKTFPMPGWKIATGQLLAPVMVLTMLAWACIMSAYIASGGVHAWKSFPPSMRAAVAISAVMVIPFLTSASLLVSNASVLMFPAWSRPMGAEQGGGFEVMGHQMIMMLGQLLCGVVFLLMPAVLFAGVGFVSKLFLPIPAAIVLGTAAGTIVMAVQVGFGLVSLGKLFERMDLSKES